MIEFKEPIFLYLIIPLLIFAYVFIYFKFYKLTTKIEIPNNIGNKINYYYLFPFLRFLILGFLFLAILNPEKNYSLVPDEKNGIDIMITIDTSASMSKSFDFEPYSRLEYSKILIKEFVKNRLNDRIGIVVFSGSANLQSPLTNDQTALISLIDQINESSVKKQGTAIGDAIALSIYRLKNSRAKSKIILLITDGVSNIGKIDPETSLEIAKNFEVKIYSIGIGKMNDQYQIDFESLMKISNETNGIFYRAETKGELQNVFFSINQLEKSSYDSKKMTYSESYFDLLFYLFLGFFLLEFLLRNTVFKFYF